MNSRSNKSLQKYFSALEHSLQGMELLTIYGTKFDRTKHGSLFLSKVKNIITLGNLDYILYNQTSLYPLIPSPSSLISDNSAADPGGATHGPDGPRTTLPGGVRRPPPTARGGQATPRPPRTRLLRRNKRGRAGWGSARRTSTRDNQGMDDFNHGDMRWDEDGILQGGGGEGGRRGRFRAGRGEHEVEEDCENQLQTGGEASGRLL